MIRRICHIAILCHTYNTCITAARLLFFYSQLFTTFVFLIANVSTHILIHLSFHLLTHGTSGVTITESFLNGHNFSLTFNSNLSKTAQRPGQNLPFNPCPQIPSLNPSFHVTCSTTVCNPGIAQCECAD